MNSVDDQCKLCDQMGPLCRSHIVPELAYKPLMNEKRQIYTLGRKIKKIQTGHYERLLCSKCEQLLSRYEHEFQQTWMDTIPSDFTHLATHPHRDIIQVEIPNFARFKLFHLSVFWRAFASASFKIESQISLGKYDDIIRQMLLNEDAGKAGDFPVVGHLKLDRKKRPEPTVTPLVQGSGRFEGHHYYMMSYAYCDWIFVVGQPGPPWLVAMEEKCIREKMFLLQAVSHEQSKSFTLWVDILNRIKQWE